MGKMSIEKKVFIECDCNSHMLMLWSDKEFMPDHVEMCFWQQGLLPEAPNWLRQIRHIWRILTVGHPYSDSIILGKEERAKLIKALQEI